MAFLQISPFHATGLFYTIQPFKRQNGQTHLNNSSTNFPSDDLSETMQKMCLSKKIPHQEIR